MAYFHSYFTMILLHDALYAFLGVASGMPTPDQLQFAIATWRIEILNLPFATHIAGPRLKFTPDWVSEYYVRGCFQNQRFSLFGRTSVPCPNNFTPLTTERLFEPARYPFLRPNLHQALKRPIRIRTHSGRWSGLQVPYLMMAIAETFCQGMRSLLIGKQNTT